MTFYTGFVVRISHDVLSDPFDGGLITQRVTMLLQWFGVATAILMACNGAMVFRRSAKYGLALIGCAAVLSLALLGLFIVHGQLDAVIDVDSMEITNRLAFTQGHRRYNQLTTIEWIASLSYLPMTVFAWRFVDATTAERAPKEAIDQSSD